MVPAYLAGSSIYGISRRSLEFHLSTFGFSTPFWLQSAPSKNKSPLCFWTFIFNFIRSRRLRAFPDMFFSSTFLLVSLMNLWIHPSVTVSARKIFTFSKASNLAVHVITCAPFIPLKIAFFVVIALYLLFFVLCFSRINFLGFRLRARGL